jgi:hypothetical protein
MIVTLELDDPSAFVTQSPVSQDFTIVPGVTDSQNVTWAVNPTDTFGRQSVQHTIKVDVAFDAQVTCQLSSESLLPADNQFHLVSSPHNTVNFATITVNNPGLMQQAEVIDALRNFVGIALTALLPIVLAGMIGLLSRARRHLVSRKGIGNNQIPAGAGLPQKTAPVSANSLRVGILLIAAGALAFVNGLLDIFMGPSTVPSFSAGVLAAILGIVLIVSGVWLILPKAGKGTVPGPEHV